MKPVCSPFVLSFFHTKIITLCKSVDGARHEILRHGSLHVGLRESRLALCHESRLQGIRRATKALRSRLAGMAMGEGALQGKDTDKDRDKGTDKQADMGKKEFEEVLMP
ncbi:hypothetical protein PAEN110709_15765 [Paenibacillus endophyticus]